ncbi:hypothetical protein BASA61_006921 [Batrachochytrium salamandrivorans]|nr:hypothetical protein BASA61_006921 [Batrachochytrium salamandrivorans]
MITLDQQARTAGSVPDPVKDMSVGVTRSASGDSASPMLARSLKGIMETCDFLALRCHGATARPMSADGDVLRFTHQVVLSVASPP